MRNRVFLENTGSIISRKDSSADCRKHVFCTESEKQQ